MLFVVKSVIGKMNVLEIVVTAVIETNVVVVAVVEDQTEVAVVVEEIHEVEDVVKVKDVIIGTIAMRIKETITQIVKKKDH